MVVVVLVVGLGPCWAGPQPLTESFPENVTANVPVWDPLVSLRFTVPVNFNMPLAPAAFPVPPVTLAVPLMVTVTGPLCPLEQPCALT